MKISYKDGLEAMKMAGSSINAHITPEKLQRYFSITKKALEQAAANISETQRKQAADFLDMAQRYYDDAQYFLNEKQDAVLAFAAINYAHGWLDAGARIGLFIVKDSRLFTVEE